MSDEEKKAIDILKDREYDFDELYCTFRHSFIKPYDKSIDTVLNLIEKQSKEIEELKEKNREQYKEFIKEHGEVCEKLKEDINKEWEDKIKAKIEFIKSLKEKFYYEENVISILQSLLEKE